MVDKTRPQALIGCVRAHEKKASFRLGAPIWCRSRLSSVRISRWKGRRTVQRKTLGVLWWWTIEENYQCVVVYALRIREVTSSSLEKEAYLYLIGTIEWIMVDANLN